MVFDASSVILLVAFFLFVYLSLRLSSDPISIMFGVLAVITLFLVSENALISFFVLVALVGIKFADFAFDKRAFSFLVLVFVVSLSAPVLADHAPGHEQLPPNEGLPDRVELVEKVLEVERLTKQPGMELLGTDYIPGDLGKLQAFLKVGEQPLETAACYVSALYPNMTYFINQSLMTPVDKDFFEGFYFLDFTAPNQTGVYMVNAICYYDTEGDTDFVTSSEAIDIGGNLIEVDSGSINDLRTINSVSHVLKGNGDCGDNPCEYAWNVTLPIGWDSLTLREARIIWQGEQDNNDETKEFVVRHNGTDYPFFNLTTKDVIENHQFILNSTFSDSTQIRVVMKVFDWDGGKLINDYLVVERVYDGAVVTDLRGNSELVISEGLSQVVTVVVDPTPEPLLDQEELVSLLLIILATLFMAFGFYPWGGIMFILWAVFYSPNIFISVFLIVLGAGAIWMNFLRRQ